jgi:hypothetical protein
MLKVYIKNITMYWNRGWHCIQALLIFSGSRPYVVCVWRTRKVSVHRYLPGRRYLWEEEEIEEV